MKFKLKFNFKLIIVLVSLFVSLLLVILGSKNKYCLSFGLMFLGVSLLLMIFYTDEKHQKALVETNQEIDNLEVDEEVDEEEKTYILQQLYIRQKKINKQQKRMRVLFGLCGVSLILLGIFGMF